MIAFLRLVLAMAVLGASLLAVIPAPTYNLWKLAVAVTEWGHLLAVIALVPLLPGWRRMRMGRVAGALSIFAIGLSLTSLVRAHLISRTLDKRLVTAFGASTPRTLTGATPLTKPLSFGGLMSGPQSPAVNVTTYVYAMRGNKPMELDLYRRSSTPVFSPVVVMIHGGSWQGGSRGDLAALNYYLAARGYIVASLAYRFAPAHPHPAATDDVNTALAYLKVNGARLGLDTTRTVLIGRSAGAQLALLSAYTLNDPAIRGVVSLYGPSDQVFGYVNPTNPRVLNSTQILEQFLQGTPATARNAYASSSPVNFVSSSTVPSLLIHGTRDELVFSRQSELLAERLAQARRPHLYLELPWATHGCDYNFSGPCGQLSTYAIERFLAAVIK